MTADAQGRHLAYDNAGRLIQATSAFSVLGEYSYDARNRRASKFSANGSTWYHYDAQGHLIEETHADGTLVRDYIWTDSTPIALITKDPTTGTETVTYLHTDYDNTPRMATNQSGSILWRWEGVFGSTLPNPAGVDVTLRYPGQTYDSETGLSYNWNRYYDPSTGRYVSSDPVGLQGGINTYTYALNSPTNFIDPLGLCAGNKNKCIQDFLENNYGYFLAEHIIPNFSLTSYWPTNPNFRNAIETTAELAVMKGGVVFGAGSLGKYLVSQGVSQGAILETGAGVATEAAAVASVSLAAFSTTAEMLAYLNCINQ